MKIYLIGMPGSGKSTIGRQLARELLVAFVDLDKEIEKREGKPIKKIFAEQGEDYFRQIESQVLVEWGASAENFVMATGGGTPCFHKGIEVINQTGISIFLDVPLHVLLSRLEKKTDRPLLDSSDESEKKDKLRDLYTSRLKCYRRASVTVKDADVSKVMTAIHLRK
jgi:shikimate kinase